MRRRLPFVVSLCAHALILGALAGADRIVGIEFAVRAGQANPALSRASRARTAPLIIERQLEVFSPADLTPPPVEIAQEAPPEVEQPAPPPPAAELDDRAVAEVPVERMKPQRIPRKASGPLAEIAPPPSMAVAVAQPVVQETPPLVDAAWSAMAEATDLPPERVVRESRPSTPAPAVMVGLIETGDAEVNALNANSPAGARVDQLPRSLPVNREPVYPEELRRQQIGGRVLLKVAIDTEGKVEQIRIATTSGQPLLDAAAMAAVRDWHFEPARRAGRPVKFEVQLPISFSIRRAGR